MRRMIAVALSLLCLAPRAARADTGEIGVVAGASLDDATLSVRGGWFVPQDEVLRVEIEALASRTLGGEDTVTRAMAGPSLVFPVAADGELDGAAWTASALLGPGWAEGARDGRGLAWSASLGARWFVCRAVVRVDLGYEGLALRDAPEASPFLAAGVAWRIGE